jgi:hypothetical protein
MRLLTGTAVVILCITALHAFMGTSTDVSLFWGLDGSYVLAAMLMLVRKSSRSRGFSISV